METMHPAVKRLLLRENTAQRTAEWYKARKGMLTASDVATAMGANPYKSRAVLLRDKCCPEDRVYSDSTATRWGNKYEDEAVALYEKRTGRRVLTFGLFQSEVYRWLGGSPDGVTTDGILLEVKCPISRAIEDSVPSHYLAQLQVLMEVLDLEVAHFVQYRPEGPFSGEEFVVTVVPRDRDWFAAALPVMTSFVEEWRALQGDPDAHVKILGRRRSVRREAPERTAEELWAAVATRACPFEEVPVDTAVTDPFGEVAGAARSLRLAEEVATASCPFEDSGGEREPRDGLGEGLKAGAGVEVEEREPGVGAPLADGGVQ